MKKHQQKWLKSALALGAMMTCSIAAHAQPDANDTPKAANPPAQTAGGNNGNRPDFRNMTPEQRQQMQAQMQAQMQQMREQSTRALLTQAGFPDAALQDAVIAFINAQDKAAQPLRDESNRLRQALRDQTGDEQLTTLLTTWRADVQAEQRRRAQALTALDAQIGFSKKPRLDALLTINGIIGDESAISGGGTMGGRGMGGFGNRGGRGGQGGQGARGGQNGGAPAGGNAPVNAPAQ